MSEFAYNRFYSYKEVEELLFAVRDAHPDICSLEALATTNEGRTIWGVTLAANCTEEDTPAKRPAFYVQGGLHAEEGMGITGSLALLYAMVENPEYRKQLETVTVYILPCINPDGSNACVTTGVTVRSMLERLPADTPNALIPQDLNGDGKVLQMRWEDPTGLWKMDPECGDLLVQRVPGDTEGPFYHVCTEGMIDNYDGGSIKGMRNLDVNRMFAGEWKDTANGGDYPGRHVEPRTVMEFLLTHPNIFAAFDIHCGTRALIFDMPANQQDANIMRKMMRVGKEITGIDPVSEANYGRAEGAKATVLPGVFRGYMQDTFGLVGATIELGNGWNSIGMTAKEIWDAPDGIMVREFLNKIIALHDAHGSKIAAPWVKYNHPQLGEVEIGGHIQGNAYFMIADDMLEILPKVTAFLHEMMNWHPKLELVNVKADALGGDVVRVRADVINTGMLGTTVLKGATGYHARYPMRLYLTGAEEILSQGGVKEFGGLDVLESQKLEWFVRAKPGAELTVTAAHPKAGVAKITVTV